ncbi:type II toxin-antitoxin system HipA family toxin [Frondihabitans sp. Leaf304]|uniref:type II toxin-antitoxin system HipA family toxin n=1 Tax=Frondihabitans sp. Leaf304 TaxID=1736329 RepID=UPI0006FB1DB6|nr:HipA domain-containing protein [Frondihabitans sp. Leaf304]KQQ28008.1 hypothetical protein ASF54_04575 [Frondihabitans sp. Leaf304]
MSTDEIRVHSERAGETLSAGTAYFVSSRSSLSTTFTYDPRYLAQLGAPAIDPRLDLVSGAQHTRGLPGAFGDGSPDRWGRNLIDKRERALARAEKRRARTLDDVDYLLGVSDHTRQGALRYSRGQEGFLAENSDVPKLISLPALLRAADDVSADPDNAAAVKALLDAGTGSLGGARPKAAVTLADGSLGLAKFPHASDQWDVMGWEATMLDLAHDAGITVPRHFLTKADGRSVLVLGRFDRDSMGRRFGYISAMTLLGSRDGEERDYGDVSDELNGTSAALRKDRVDLYDRVAFSVAVHNTDDHLRNLGLLDTGRGWRLAPLFDVNPNPDEGATRRTSIAGAASRDDEGEGLIAFATDCGLPADTAHDRLMRLARSLAVWRGKARANSVPENQLSSVGHVIDEGAALLERTAGSLS